MASPALPAHVEPAVRERTVRLYRAWMLACGAPLVLTLLLTDGGAISVVMLALSGVALLYTRTARTLKVGRLAPARLVAPPSRVNGAPLPLERHLPLWVAEVEYLIDGSHERRRFLLFSDEALRFEGEAGAVLLEPGNAINCLPVTTFVEDPRALHEAMAQVVLPSTAAARPAARAGASAPAAAPTGPPPDRCTVCDHRLRVVDRHCESCGTEIDAAQRARIEAHLNRQRSERLQTTRTLGAEVNKAANAIAILAGLFVVGGFVMFFLTRSQADDLLTRFEGRAADAVVQVEGQTVSVGEIREQLESAPRQVLLLNLVLAVIMGALYLWARQSPLPAVITALAVFVMVHLVNALLDPMTLAQGIPIKVFAIITLVAGIRAALQQRAMRAA